MLSSKDKIRYTWLTSDGCTFWGKRSVYRFILKLNDFITDKITCWTKSNMKDMVVSFAADQDQKVAHKIFDRSCVVEDANILWPSELFMKILIYCKFWMQFEVVAFVHSYYMLDEWSVQNSYQQTQLWFTF